MSSVVKAAKLSDDGVYRYTLSRIWDADYPPVLFIGLNPSTADAEVDDPTIRRCVGYAREWGYGGLLMGNLFAYRATNPKDLPAIPFENSPVLSPVGEFGPWHAGDRESMNTYHLRKMADRAGLIVAAWGSTKLPCGWEYQDRVVMRDLGRPLHALGLTKDGHPRHPLYMRADARPRPLKIVRSWMTS